MLTNEQMESDRYGKWARARKAERAINAALENGKSVQVATYTRVVEFTKRHIGMIKAGRDGLYMQRGKKWDYIGFCRISVF